MQDIFRKITELLEEDETFAVATIIGHSGSVPRRVAKMVVRADGSTIGTIGGGCVEGNVITQALQLLREGKKGVHTSTFDLIEEEYGGAGMTCGGKVNVAIEILEPTPRLVVLGSGHMALALTKMGKLLGFSVIMVDPLAKEEKFPEADRVITNFVEKGLLELKPSRNSYVVILTRHKDDLPALRSALSSKAAYIGLIGSRRRVAQAFNMLLKEGFTEEQLARVNAPVGLDIGAETPEEIALSIMAEIVQLRRIGLEKPATTKKLQFSAVRAVRK